MRQEIRMKCMAGLLGLAMALAGCSGNTGTNTGGGTAAGGGGMASPSEGGLSLKESAPIRQQQQLARAGESAAADTARLNNDALVSQAMARFNAYVPKIEASHNGRMELKEPHTGDFTGDGLDDVAVYFVVSPKEGGNAVIGQGLTLYRNTGNGVQVIAGYEPDYRFAFKKIANGRIYVDKVAYAPDDGACCPSIREEKVLTISGSSVY